MDEVEMPAHTSLLLAGSRLAPDSLLRLVPPQVTDGSFAPLQWRAEDSGLLRFTWSLPETDLEKVREILPCFSCISTSDYGYRFFLEFETLRGARPGRAVLDPIGDFQAADRQSPEESNSVETAIDLFVVKEPLRSARLQLAVSAQDSAELQTLPTLLSVSMRRSNSPASAVHAGSGAEVDLPVPSRSQRVLDPKIAPHVCSPTSISMVLDFYGRSTDVRQVIQQARHGPSGLHGVWPANIFAASRWGMLGYLLHFSSWDAARHLLDKGIPLIASVRYQKGELSRAAVSQTAGHLLVLRGYGRSAVRVNDPGAATPEDVDREYDLEEFTRIWLERAAVGYVIFPGDAVRA